MSSSRAGLDAPPESKSTSQVGPAVRSYPETTSRPSRVNDAASPTIEPEGRADDKDSERGQESDGSEDDYNQSLKRRGTMSKSYSTTDERQVLRKLDRRLTLLLCILYLLSFLDRSNIGNARVAGLQTSLRITDAQFDLTLLAFYVTYITFEWMILLYRLIPPHIYIASCVFAWGLVACLQSTVTSFTQLLVLRAMLGITEAAFGPGVPFYMTFFYRREELAYRVGLQISAAPLATSFASSLAWVIVKLSENGPLESWRALFLFEGFPSIIAAVFAYHIIPDSPSQARWLSARERKVATLRLQNSGAPTTSTSTTQPSYRSSQQTTNSKLNAGDLVATLSDPKAWLAALMFLSVNVSFASLPVFLPTIIKDMSFSAVTSQILAAPPYLFAFVFVLLISRASDRIPDSRGSFIMVCAGLSCVSYTAIALVGVLSSRTIVGERLSIVLRYISVYGAAMGLFASVVLIITWQLNNQASTTGKGVGMVILNVVGQTGPLIGVKLFPERQGPYFVAGMSVCAGFMGGVVLLAAGLRVYLGRLNRKSSDNNGGRERKTRESYEMVAINGKNGDEGSDGAREDEGEGEGGNAEEAEGLVSGETSRSSENSSHRTFRYML